MKSLLLMHNDMIAFINLDISECAFMGVHMWAVQRAGVGQEHVI